MSERYSGDLNQLLSDGSVVAVVSQQKLRPAEGDGMPFFPPTYLGTNEKPTYCISSTGDGSNLCTVDSVQSQANRVEEAFLQEPYRSLIRRVEVTAKLPNNGSRTLDMLQLGHRLADAAVSFSTIGDQARQAMRAFKDDPVAVAELSPMSLLCGLWESRGEGSQLKIPRAFSAIITAKNVSTLRRMTTFFGSFPSKDLGLTEKHSAEGIDNALKEALGGVIAQGDIVRTATLNFVALRQNLKVRPGQPVSATATYVYGLGLVAMAMQPEVFLRQGCLLVGNGPSQMKVVYRDGAEREWSLDADQVMAFAQQGAAAFGVAALLPIQAEFQVEADDPRLQAKQPKKKTPPKEKTPKAK